MTDRGLCVETTVPPSWHSPTVVNNILEDLEMHLLMSTILMSTFCFCHVYSITDNLMHTFKLYDVT